MKKDNVIININNVSKEYDGVLVVDNFNLYIKIIYILNIFNADLRLILL